jgi:hypothetical protein
VEPWTTARGPPTGEVKGVVLVVRGRDVECLPRDTGGFGSDLLVRAGKGNQCRAAFTQVSNSLPNFSDIQTTALVSGNSNSKCQDPMPTSKRGVPVIGS